MKIIIKSIKITNPVLGKIRIMKKILCKIFGHKYSVSRNVSPTIRELSCERCSKEFGMNDEFSMVLPLDKDLKEAHDVVLAIKP